MVTETLVENSGLSVEDKAEELNRSLSILRLQQKTEAQTITEWEQEALGIYISLQRTKEELLSTPQETSTANLLDFTLLKLGNATKQYQRTLKKSQVDTLRDISNKLNEQRNNPDITDAEILEIETEADFILETICNQEAQKMETF